MQRFNFVMIGIMSILNSSGQNLDTSFCHGLSGLDGSHVGDEYSKPKGADRILILNNDYLIAGSFMYVHEERHNGIAVLDISTGKVKNPKWAIGKGFDGMINDVISIGNSLIVAGYFKMINEEEYPGLIRLKNEGGVVSIDESFNPALGRLSNVAAICLQTDGKILVGGYLEEEGYPCAIVRLNSDGSFDESFEMVLGENGSVERIILTPENNILATGNFKVNSKFQPIISIRKDGTINKAWGKDLRFAGAYYNNEINDIKIGPDRKIYIAGCFPSISGFECGGIARLNSNGTLDKTFSPGKGCQEKPTSLTAVNDIEFLPDGRLLLAGNFERFSGVKKIGLVTLYPNGKIDNKFTPRINDQYASVADVMIDPKTKTITAVGIFGVWDYTERQQGIVKFNY